MTPEALVQLIVGLSQPRDRNELSTKLKQSGEVFATARVAALLQCLNNLNPTEHSLGFTFFLYALGERSDAPAERFLFLASGFLQTCEAEQVKLCPEQFAGVCRMMKNSFITLGRPRQGIIPLQAAIRKLQPDKETLTPMHADLFQLCLLSKCYGAALPFVDEDIYEVDPKATATTTTDVLLYGYYGGMVQTGRRAYGQALDMLLVTLTCPAAAASSIQLHAYKKFVLLQILEAGTPHGPAKSAPAGVRPVWAESGEKGIPLRPNLSKSMSSVVTRAVRTFAGPYDELAAAFNRNNLPALQAKYAQHASVFAQDGNAGLAKLVLSAVVKRRMQSLTQTYVTLSLNDIASEVGLASAAEAQAYILRLVASDEIHAEIDEGDGMVRFRDRPKLFDSVEASRQLDACIRNVIDINGRVTLVNDQISTDRRYIELLPLREDRSRLEGIMSYLHPGTSTEPR